jgi:glycerophosphoryl diester phosphodiesterase
MVRKVKYFFIALITLLLFGGCKKIKYYPDKEFDGSITRFLAHRGGVQAGYQENSVESAANGLANLDGIEVDIQISKDGTIWLSHNNIIDSCNLAIGQCFSLTPDSIISEINSCKGIKFSYSKLESVFELMAYEYKDSYISIDFKSWSPCSSDEWDLLGTFEKVANTIVTLAEKYKLESNIMVESETAEFLDYVKDENSNIKCYLTAFGDFERGMLKALENGYDGISFQYKFDEEINAQHLELLHRKGLKIQLWTVDSQSDLDEAVSIKPDFIQTENISYASQLKSKEAE